MRKILDTTEEVEEPVQPAVRVRDEERCLQQGLFRICRYPALQGQKSR